MSKTIMMKWRMMRKVNSRKRFRKHFNNSNREPRSTPRRVKATLREVERVAVVRWVTSALPRTKSANSIEKWAMKVARTARSATTE